MKEIQTVGRRRLAVRSEGGNVKIDILLGEHRIATLDLPQQAAADLEQEINAVRDKPPQVKATKKTPPKVKAVKDKRRKAK